MVNLKNIFCALLLSGMLTACGSEVVDQYITEIERTTKEIKAATTFEEVTVATERLMKWEREHYDALQEELEDNKVKQAAVNRAHKEFMQAGMTRTFEFAKEKAATE
ncbi:MAG: hypothetical protein IKT92_07040 [Bacteroidaceae bacterium]|nr:hypothetical protein [Bacteroidaceae bacterium]